MNTKHTPGPWLSYPGRGEVYVAERTGEHTARLRVIATGATAAHARLIAAAPTQNEEMLRYLPVLERAEADVELWERLTAGTGIATLNGYRAAIAKATGEQA